MKCVDRVRRLAESCGATVDDGCEYDLVIDAPRGYVWAANFEAVLVEPCENSSGETWRNKASREIIDRMKHGLEKCDAEMTATIEHERDEPWEAPEGAPEFIEVKEG